MPNTAAFILLDEPTALDWKRFAESLSARHPNQTFNMPKGDGKGAIILSLAGAVVAVMQVGTPLPDGWQTAAARAAMRWPAANAAFKRHRSHLIVSIMGELQDRLEAARIVTAVAGAIVATHAACSGMLWSTEVASSREAIIDLSPLAFAPYPDFPSALWVSMHPSQDTGTSIVRAVTVGLRKFIGRELEIEGQRSQLEEVLTTEQSLINYLLQPGIELNDGDTIGESAGEHLKVRAVSSPTFNGLPVFAVRLPSP